MYAQIRDSDHEMDRLARNFVEELWRIYQTYVDADFERGIAVDFLARYWEMHLACILLQHRLCLLRRDERRRGGPDIGIVNGHQMIWIEAVTPGPGMDGSRDRVPAIPTGRAAALPEREILLRYTGAMREKIRRREDHLTARFVSPSDPYVIAVNSAKMPFWGSGDPPTPLKAVYPFGNQYLTLDRTSGEVLNSAYHRRDSIRNTNDQNVPTDLFLDCSSSGISGALFARDDPWNQNSNSGSHLIYVHNYRASHPLPRSLLPVGREYELSEHDETLELRQIMRVTPADGD
jgi:hypothetical protein